MKQKLSNFLFGLLCVAGQIVHAQDNGCNMSWSNPARAIYNSEGTIYYVVQFSKCSSSSICGWPKIALEHTFPFPVSISLTLSGIQCDGTAIKGDYSTASNEISANSRYINQGNWHTFKSVTEVVRVEVSYHKGNDYYRIVYDKEKGINETYINNKTIAEYNASKQQSSASGSSSNSTKTTYSTASTANKPATNSNSSAGYSTSSTYNNNNSNSNSSNYNATNAILNNYNTQVQNNRRNADAVTDGIQQLGNLFMQNAEQKRAEREEREERKRIQEEQKQRETAERETREAKENEEVTQLQIDDANYTYKTQSDMDKKCIGKYMINRKTSEIPNNVNQVYYITYDRNPETFKLTVRTYTLNKYSDNTWMFKNDMLNKIKFTDVSYTNSNGYVIGEKYILGFFINKTEVNNALNQIKNADPTANIDNSFLAINETTTTQKTDKDFWNN
ncbi:hypothetical protein [Flavobacterium quisquiliarum]|uniref:Uncharacterized protein n=1 Tax=Flavobacterium quisquiliarum TaxID=1834436 RepID=A0ABV8W7F4_9FLAO|nr:hypothetical protein [Flavobacterium quisquiliarum]MBW1655351.1 hypothetical protein [Flavobacterium quisquiliarum]NWL00737.1 hypothetical protein [Flavobacterium collinsii]